MAEWQHIHDKDNKGFSQSADGLMHFMLKLYSGHGEIC